MVDEEEETLSQSSHSPLVSSLYSLSLSLIFLPNFSPTFPPPISDQNDLFLRWLALINRATPKGEENADEDAFPSDRRFFPPIFCFDALTRDHHADSKKLKGLLFLGNVGTVHNKTGPKHVS